MASAKQIAANQRNAQNSTGPKSLEGKAAVRLNAVKHGLTASSIVIPYLESDADWEIHRQGILESLKPQGHLETVLAERIAMLMWRLGRVTRYEREMIAIQIEGAEADHFKRDKDFKSLEDINDAVKYWQSLKKFACNLPELAEDKSIEKDWADEVLELAFKHIPEAQENDLLEEEFPDVLSVYDIEHWNAGLLLKALHEMIELSNDSAITLEKLLHLCAEAAERKMEELVTQRQKAASDIEQARRTHLLADMYVTNRVSRYEPQLERSLYKALRELQRFQANRPPESTPPSPVINLPATDKYSVN